MKKVIYSVVLSFLWVNALNAQVTIGSYNQMKTYKDNISQAEYLSKLYFDSDKYLLELKSEFNLSNEVIKLIANDYSKFAFKKKIEFIKEYKEGNQTVYTVETYFKDVKADIKNKLTQLVNTPNYIEKLKKKQAKIDLHEEKSHGQELRGPGDPCTNPDFEMCDFTNWDLIRGQVPTAPTAPYSFQSPVATTCYSTVNTAVAAGSCSGTDQHYICNGGTDPNGFPMVFPGGTCSAALGDFAGTGNMASQIRQTYLVSSSDAILILNYAVVLQDPAHTPEEQPYFRMRVYDQGGNSIACGEYEAVAGDGQPGWVSSSASDIQYKPWSTVFIPMAPYIGQNVTVEFTVGDCSQGGHYGYAYVDASCDAMALDMTAQAVCAGQPITITGPAGAASYLWNTGATTQGITTSTPGTYSVTVTPVTGSACAITLDTTIGSYPNPIADFSNDAPVCAGQNVNFTDLSNPNGTTIASYSWDFGDASTSTLQNPSHAYATDGTYNVTLTITTTDGCTDDITYPVTITPGGNPTVNPAGPFCATDAPFVMTAATAGGTWSATCGACINATTGSFDPALATNGVNTITYTVATGCGGVDTEDVIVESITLDNLVSTEIDCFGNCNGTITMTATGATQFSNNGGGTFQATGNFTGLCANTYNMVAETAIGCQVTGTVTITEPAILDLPTAFTDETCFGSCDGVAIVAPQGGTSPYTYSWSNGGGNVPTINGLCVGVYTVTVTDDNGCTDNANITISGPPQLLITNITPVDESCSNACDGSITVTAPGATQFSIDNGVTFQATGVFNNICSGNYDIVVLDASGCQATGNTSVTTPNPINIVAGPNSTICIGQSATVSANANGGTGTLDYIWDNALPNASSHNVTPAVTTTYTVFAEDDNGCTSPPVQITVTLNPPLNVVAQSDQSICVGESANISALASGGNGGPYTYVWDDGAGNLLNGANQTVSPAVTTTYTVTASDNCGTPVATDAVTITVNPLPVVTFTADNLEGCTPVPVNFTNTTDPLLSGSCFWDFGDGTNSTDCNPSHVFTTPGCYTITLTVTSPDGCVGSLTTTNMICVYPYPVAEFSFGPQPTDILNTEINFTNESTGGIIYDWDFAGLGTSQNTNPTFVFPNDDPGTYNVCLVTENSNGCMDSICHTVVINDLFLLYVPNTFTPDGDGINDYFFPVIDGYDPENFNMMIFNRWGELIFESSSPDNKWDGTYKGLMSQEDTYVWKIITKDVGTGKKRDFIGHVNLLK